MSRAALAAWILVAAIALAGCSSTATRRARGAASEEQREAERALKEMAETPKPLRRPVILLTGWAEPPSNWNKFRERLEAATCGCDRVILVPDLRAPGGLIAAADTVAELCAGLGEVDVVAHSAGGLVAREAARSSRGSKRLHVARLFAIATPHTGTFWGKFWPIIPFPLQAADCRPGSGFLESLATDPSTTAMSISTYWAEGDIVVPRASTEAVGTEHRVYARAPGSFVHRYCGRDPRFARDVITKLLE